MVPVEPFEALGSHVADQQQGLVEPNAEHKRLRAALLARAVVVRRGRWRARVAIGLAAALAAAGGAAYLTQSMPRDLTYFVSSAVTPSSVGSWISAASGETLKIRFSDGTHASLWPEARGRITRLTPNGADLVIEQGHASFNVVHRELSRWQVSTGPFVVQVTGTQFDVEWQPEKDSFKLELYQGHVRVSGCALGSGQDLHAGQRLEASCARNEFGISALSNELSLRELPVGAPAAQARVEPEPEHANPRLPVANPVKPGAESLDSWPALARQGRFADAYGVASNAGFDAECAARGAPEVLLLGDAARLSGHIDRARQAYQAVRLRWLGSPGAALAAFQMGRAEFDQRRDYAAAQNWLRTYLKEQPNGEFAAPALGRLMEAEVRLNRLASARELAKSYLDRYPKGAHADAAHQLLEAPTAGAR